MPLRVLIVGAGVCGPAFAALLRGSDHRHDITVVERSSSLRLTGQQIDLKGQGVAVARKMSVLPTIKSLCIAETGMGFVDGSGRTLMQFNVDDANKGAISRSVTSEYEVMRGDLVKVLYDVSLRKGTEITNESKKEAGVHYEFGMTLAKLTQDGGGVDVTFSDGQERRYDIVVGADGQGSMTRRLAFGQAVSDESFKSLRTHAAFYSIPRVDGEGEIAKTYIAPGRRGIMTRTGDRPVTQVFLFSMDSERLGKVSREPIEKQKEAWAETFEGAGWQTPRFLDGLKRCNDFYASELAQVKLKHLYNGRVVLIGDAGYCPSVMTGMGTTAALVGSYVLAGELSKYGKDVDSALQAYEKVMQIPVPEYQTLPTGGSPGAFWPSSRLAVWFLHNTLWALSTFKIDRLIQQILPKGDQEDTGGWIIPEYPKLNLRS